MMADEFRNDPARGISAIRQKFNKDAWKAFDEDDHRLRQREITKVRIALWQRNMMGLKSLDGEMLYEVNQ